MPLRINGETIADDVLREEERLIRPQLQQAMSHEDDGAIEKRVVEWARENVIERTVLRQEALRDPEPVAADDLEKMLEEVRSQSPGRSGCVAPYGDEQLRKELETRFRVDRLLGRLTAKAAPPKNKDVSDYYVKNRGEYQQPETIHAAHIVKNVDEKTDEATARGVMEEVEKLLQNGGDFAALADQYSDCPGRGGDLGFFPRGQMVDEFDEIVFALQPGQTSEIFRTQFGFHIARLIERRAAGQRSLQEVKDEIAGLLLQQKRQKTVEQYLDRLIASAKVEEEA